MNDMTGANTTDHHSHSHTPLRASAHPPSPVARTPLLKAPHLHQHHHNHQQQQLRGDKASTASAVVLTGDLKNKDASTIHLFGAPSTVTDGYVLDLSSRWGTVISISRQTSKLVAGAQEMIIVYSKDEEAEEALRHLDGGVLFGSPLQASLRTSLVQKHLETFSKPLSPQEEAQQAAGGPRNLYVLNLSLEMTNQELERLFSVFGSVNHVCIMAVLDSLGRRRAFVDMATGEAARQAIATLHGTAVHGYKIDVSFAIIQRSGGPVTDYPPTPLKRAQQASLHLSKHPSASASAFYRQQIQMQTQADMYSALPTSTGNELIPFTPQQPSPAFFGQATMNPAFMSMAMPMAPMAAMPTMQTVDLYVANLDPVAILDDEDLASVFKQFGTVIGAKLALDPNGNSMGVGFVRISTPQEAEYARLQMQGRVMDSKRISVTFSPPIMASPTYSNYGSPMLGSVASSIFPSPVTPPYMSPWHSTPTNYMAMPHIVGEHDMTPLMMGMNGLGISHHMSSPLAGGQYPADLHTHQSRGTTYFTRKGQEHGDSSRFEPQSSVSSSHRAEDSLGQSSHASILSPIHSREASVETSATSNQAGSLDIKTVEDSGSDGRGEASPLGASVSSTQAAGAGEGKTMPVELPGGLTVNEGFGERGRAATSEAVLRSPRMPQPGKKGFMVSTDGSPLRRGSGRRPSKTRMLSRSASATEVA